MTYRVSWSVLDENYFDREPVRCQHCGRDAVDGFEAPAPPWKFWLSGYGDGYVTLGALIEEPDEDAAWGEVYTWFKVHEERFCQEAPGMTHEKLAEGGRFT